MRRKGFTLVELLVVIAIIALLMGILMPALARVRQMAYRMVCGTRLSGIGKAILLYAQDNDEDYPRAGGRQSEWDTDGEITDWDAVLEADAFGAAQTATIGSCFYLLVKYADVTLKQFICSGDVGAGAFKMSDYSYDAQNIDEDIDVWDFGSQPSAHCSYSYHMPFDWENDCTGRPIGATSNPSSPVCADRNPYLDKNAEGDDDDGGSYVDGYHPDDDAPTWDDELVDRDNTMNSAAHQRDGQSVLYNDISARFQLKPNCGIMNDNIYKQWPSCASDEPSDEQKQLGTLDSGGSSQTTGNGGPWDETDAFLVNEHQDTGTEAGTEEQQ